MSYIKFVGIIIIVENVMTAGTQPKITRKLKFWLKDIQISCN